jgi:argininosuccinate synthase
MKSKLTGLSDEYEKRIKAMKADRIITNLEGIKGQNFRKCLVLYSGGVDGSFFLLWAKRNNLETIALHISLLEDRDRLAETNAKKIGVRYEAVNRIEEFANYYLSHGIAANAKAGGIYPVCSSLSRPLLAKAALEFAKRNKIEAIVHTCTAEQNSAYRFNLSFKKLDPQILVIAPFMESNLSRKQKISLLSKAGIVFKSGLYSIDQNIWGRVIESGPFDKPEFVLDPDTGIFKWTNSPSQVKSKPIIIEICFERGIPTKIDGIKMPLAKLVKTLNKKGGKYGIGRFDNLERNSLGRNRREIREAPAAEILITAHKELESCIFDDRQSTIKRILDSYWTDLICRGHWYSDKAQMIYEMISQINEHVNGNITVRLSNGRAMVVGRNPQMKANLGKVIENIDLLFYNSKDSHYKYCNEGNDNIKGFGELVIINRTKLKNKTIMNKKLRTLLNFDCL